MQALLLTLALAPAQYNRCDADEAPPARYRRMPPANGKAPPGVRESVQDEAPRQWAKSLAHFRKRQELVDSDVDALRARGWRGRFSWERDRHNGHEREDDDADAVDCCRPDRGPVLRRR